MRRHVSGSTPRIIFTVAITFALLAVMAWAPGSRATRNSSMSAGMSSRRVKDFVPGEVLVRYKSEKLAQRQASVRAVRTPAGVDLPVQVERFEGSNLVPGLRIARVAAESTLEAIAALKNQSDVLYAEPNYLLYADATPNDPRFAEQYGLSKIGAPTAWNTTQGSSNVVIGVLDQGIDFSHQDLSANKFVNPAPGSIAGISGDVNGYNFVNNSGTVFSGNPNEDHATHVGGIAGAVGNNGIGVAGVNWAVRLMSLKFLSDTGSGSTSNAIRACDYAREMRQLYVNSGGTQGANVRV